MEFTGSLVLTKLPSLLDCLVSFHNALISSSPHNEILCRKCGKTVMHQTKRKQSAMTSRALQCVQSSAVQLSVVLYHVL